MPKYKMKFMFDWGSGVCLWSANKAAKERFHDYPIFISKLPVSETLKAELEHLIHWHDEALNWDEPNGDLLWSNEQIEIFLETAKKVFHCLCDELGADYEVELIETM